MPTGVCKSNHGGDQVDEYSKDDREVVRGWQKQIKNITRRRPRQIITSLEDGRNRSKCYWKMDRVGRNFAKRWPKHVRGWPEQPPNVYAIYPWPSSNDLSIALQRCFNLPRHSPVVLLPFFGSPQAIFRFVSQPSSSDIRTCLVVQ
ncbi:unnamed protein product [Ilex paraguariensis]|uniref:Uncharacterized protein n=1 Tax=Ilex paraguariensis TaxID=185542 RepID=A0ABC8TX97_9AQUA